MTDATDANSRIEPASGASPGDAAPADANPYVAPKGLESAPAGSIDELKDETKRFAGVSHNAIFSVLDQVFVSGLSFGTSILIGRSDAAALGVYALAMTLVNFYRSVQGELITAPFSVYGQRQDQQQGSLAAYAGSIHIHQVFTTAFSTLFVLGAMAVMRIVGAPSEVQSTLMVLAFAMPMITWHSFVRQYCFARLRFGLCALIDVVVAVVQMGGLLWLFRTDSLSTQRVFAVTGAAMSVGIVVWLFGRQEKLQFSLSAALADWKRNWKFSRWALASQLVGCSTPFLLPWAISFTHGEYDTGVFSACVTTLGLSTLFVVAVANVLTPITARVFAREGVAGLTRILWKGFWAFTVVIGGFAGFVFLTGDLLVLLFYGDQYAHTQTICRLLVFGILMNSYSVIAGNGLWAVDRPQGNLPGDATVLVVTVVASMLLIPPYGIIGAALATVLGATLGCMVRFFMLFHVLGELQSESDQAQNSLGATDRVQEAAS